MVPGKGRSRERSVYLSRLVGNTAYAAPVYKTKRPSPEGQAVRFFPEKTLLLSIKAAHDDFPAHGENARYTHSFSFVQFSCPNAARLTSPVHDLPSRSLRPNGCCSPRLRRFGHFLAFTVPFAEGITQFLLNCRLTGIGLYGGSHTTSQKGETAPAARGRGDGFPRQPAGCLGMTGCPRLRARRRGTRIANQ